MRDNVQHTKQHSALHIDCTCCNCVGSSLLEQCHSDACCTTAAAFASAAIGLSGKRLLRAGFGRCTTAAAFASAAIATTAAAAAIADLSACAALCTIIIISVASTTIAIHIGVLVILEADVYVHDASQLAQTPEETQVKALHKESRVELHDAADIHMHGIPTLLGDRCAFALPRHHEAVGRDMRPDLQRGKAVAVVWWWCGRG